MSKASNPSKPSKPSSPPSQPPSKIIPGKGNNNSPKPHTQVPRSGDGNPKGGK